MGISTASARACELEVSTTADAMTRRNLVLDRNIRDELVLDRGAWTTLNMNAPLVAGMLRGRS
ncbi:hypothetical protein ASD81_16240 [Nocardioides sp. Root614]|nr:hypothetical protein ASD81_16240 [Nocardioides sp. Root614]